jgi:hypothetical protein
MPHLSSRRRKSAATFALPVALLACIGLTACGGSSASTTTSTTANAAATSTQATGAATTATTPAGTSTGTTPAGTPGSAARPGAGRFAAVRACLQKDGVTLPRPPAGGGRGGFAGADGGLQLPKGMTRAQYHAALVKCGGGDFRGPGATGGKGRALDSPRFRQALTSFATCLRQNGVNIPMPNTSGKGPIFGTKGIDVKSPQFKRAELKCRATLLAGLRTGSAGSAAAGSGATGSATSTTGG